MTGDLAGLLRHVSGGEGDRVVYTSPPMITAFQQVFQTRNALV